MRKWDSIGVDKRKRDGEGDSVSVATIGGLGPVVTRSDVSTRTLREPYRNLMEESAYHGLLFGSTSPFATPKDLKETILDYLRSPQLPTGAGPFRETFPHSGERDIAIAWSPEAVISLTVSGISKSPPPQSRADSIYQ
jgi:hypothetical protein